MALRGCFLAITLAIGGAAPASALTCEAFQVGFDAADRGDLLPTPEIRQIPDMPEGYLEIGNFRNLNIGLQCRDGELRGLGASPIEFGEADILRWSALLAATLRLAAPEVADPMAVAAKAQKAAIADGERNAIKIGFASGTSETPIGGFLLTLTTAPGVLQFDVSRRD